MNAPQVDTSLPQEVFMTLQQEPLLLLTTIDTAMGMPITHAISWLYAPHDKLLRFALDGRASLCAHLHDNAPVNVTCFAEETIYVIYGRVRVRTPSLEQVPFALICYEIDVDHVRPAMFYGAKISAPPQYTKTYDLRAAKKLDDQVFTAMKSL